MPGRKYGSGNGYRFGFNGKEQDAEVKGMGVQYDYGFRIYDSRLGRFLSVDPLTKQYPFYTPYQFASNSPIAAIDLDGLESKIQIANSNLYSSDCKLPFQHSLEIIKLQEGIVDHVHKSILLKASDLKAQEKTPAWMQNANLTTEEYDQIIKSTISEFLKFSEAKIVFDFKDFKLHNKITADIDYEKIKKEYNIKTGNDLKNTIVEAATVVEFVGTLQGIDNPPLVGAEILNNISENDGNSFMKNSIVAIADNLDKVGVKWLTPALATRLAGTIGWLLTPVDATNGGNSQELKENYTNKAIRSTISAMFFYFINENKVNTKEIKIDNGPKVDNLRNNIKRIE